MITQQTPQVHNQHPTLYTLVHTQHLHLVHTQHPTWYTSNTHTWYTWCPYSTIPPGTKSTSPLHLVPTFNTSILFHTTKLSTRSCLSLSPTPFLLRKRRAFYNNKSSIVTRHLSSTNKEVTWTNSEILYFCIPIVQFYLCRWLLQDLLFQ